MMVFAGIGESGRWNCPTSLSQKNQCIHLSIVSARSMLRGCSPLIGHRFCGCIVYLKLRLEQAQRGNAADNVADARRTSAGG